MILGLTWVPSDAVRPTNHQWQETQSPISATSHAKHKSRVLDTIETAALGQTQAVAWSLDRTSFPFFSRCLVAAKGGGSVGGSGRRVRRIPRELLQRPGRGRRVRQMRGIGGTSVSERDATWTRRPRRCRRTSTEVSFWNRLNKGKTKTRDLNLLQLL